MFSSLLSWRRVCCAVAEPRLLPGGIGLSVQDGAQASEGGVLPRLDSVGRGQRGLIRGRLHGADVVGGLVRSSPPQVSQVGEAQLLWLLREEQILVRHGQSAPSGPTEACLPCKKRPTKAPFKPDTKVVGSVPGPCHLKLFSSKKLPL